ncbi:MAG: DUF4249 family protein [Salinivirgaceae bacterium]|nr:DUF4249 family protein [Salinivirgaceae bacterium]
MSIMYRYIFNITFILFTLSFLFVSCEDLYYEDISKITDNKALMVEIVLTGGITSEMEYQEITLTKPILLNEHSIDSISGAAVNLKIGNNNYEFIEEISHPNINNLHKRKGTYVSRNQIKGIPGAVHTLAINYSGKTYTASEIMEEVDPFDFNSIDLPSKSGGGGYDTLGVLVNPLLNQIIFNFGATESCIYNWIAVDTIFGYDKSESSLYYFKVVDQQGLLSEMYSERISYLGIRMSYKITVKKSSMSQQYENYLIAVLKETYWNNNLFSTMSANVPTNLSTGGLGYFYASDIYTQTISARALIHLIDLNE